MLLVDGWKRMIQSKIMVRSLLDRSSMNTFKNNLYPVGIHAVYTSESPNKLSDPTIRWPRINYSLSLALILMVKYFLNLNLFLK